MIGKEFKSIVEIMEAFPDEQSCIDYLEEIRWHDGVVSPFDEDSKVYKCKDNKYYCKNTGKYFNVRTQTLYEGTKISLRSWFIAIWQFNTHKKGISSYQLSRELGITQKTAWFLLHRIRMCYGVPEDERLLEGVVQLDETFVGGRNRFRHKDKKVPNARGRSFKDKTPVFGMLEQGGRVIAQVVRDTSTRSLTPIILKRISRKATLYTDEWGGYSLVSKLYNREYVEHRRKQYANGKVTTNAIEGFWSQFKRGIVGIYHKVSRKHLQKYVDEFSARYNWRKMSDGMKFNLFLCKTGHRLKYKELTNG